METVKIALIREGKKPEDRRVPLTPAQAKALEQRFSHVKIICQTSSWRCFSDQEYAAAGIAVQEDISSCDYMLGIKEVPVAELVPHKTYLFFSHTIKQQAHNRKLLQTVLAKQIRLIDYECLTDAQGERIIAFGRFAGIVGAYNGLYTYGKKFGLYDLKRAKDCADLEALKHICRALQLPPVRIVLTGKGRAGRGAAEILQEAGIRKMSPADYLQHSPSDCAVFTQLEAADYYCKKDQSRFNKQEFYQHPERFASGFAPYTRHTNILMAAAYWDQRAPALFTREDMLHPDFHIQVIADITCDIDGAIPATKKASTIAEPVYDYDASQDKVVPPFADLKQVSVMAIDNLPSELPRDASQAFGEKMLSEILPALLQEGEKPIITRATIAEQGRLTTPYAYLQAYVEKPA